MNIVLYIAIVLSAMGAFDTLYYHEYKLGLPTLPTAKLELRLHAVRDFFYATIFFSFGWLEWRGAFAAVFAVIILTEIFITMWDFVEEDMTRKLPKGERVMHSAMGIVYGTLLASLAPVLWSWWQSETGFVRADYGWQSFLMAAMAIGVFGSGLRDLWASFQMEKKASVQ